LLVFRSPITIAYGVHSAQDTDRDNAWSRVRTLTDGTHPGQRSAYARFCSITTRWMDNDVYGHVNNVVYYAFFDTAVNRMLIEEGVLDIERSSLIGLVVETQCRYFAPITFPDAVAAGVRIARIGTSSVQYEVGLFRNEEDSASAEGRFVHVYVDRRTRRPKPIEPGMRAFLNTILIGAAGADRYE
jgi:acyl-CoA thioester hydrolase